MMEGLRVRVFAGERLSEYKVGPEAFSLVDPSNGDDEDDGDHDHNDAAAAAVAVPTTVADLRVLIMNTEACGGPYRRFSFVSPAALETAPHHAPLLPLLRDPSSSSSSSLAMIDIETFDSPSSPTSSSTSTATSSHHQPSSSHHDAGHHQQQHRTKHRGRHREHQFHRQQRRQEALEAIAAAGELHPDYDPRAIDFNPDRRHSAAPGVPEPRRPRRADHSSDGEDDSSGDDEGGEGKQGENTGGTEGESADGEKSSKHDGKKKKKEKEKEKESKPRAMLRLLRRNSDIGPRNWIRRAVSSQEAKKDHT